MVTSKQLIDKYGDPRFDTTKWEMKNLASYSVPANIIHENGHIPSKIYCHHDFAKSVIDWLTELATTKDAAGELLIKEIKTWDGCFNIRMKRGLNALSLHAFAMAVDVNASQNPLGLRREDALRRGLNPFSPDFIQVSRKHMECGADWTTRPDGMHFQIKQLPS